MASLCPKCGRKLKLTDLKPQCPGCGTNLLYYKIEERLETDALNAEIEHAHTQKKLDRAKAAMVGSPLAIARLVLYVLIVAAFCLPLAKMSAAGPFFESNSTYSAIQIVTELMDFDFGALGLIGAPVVGDAALYFAITVVCVAVAALFALFELIFSFLSCSPRGFSRNIIFSAIGLVASVGSIFAFNKFISSMNTALPGFTSGSVSFGIYIVAALFAASIILTVVIKVTDGVKVNYKPCYIGKNQIPYEEFVEKYGDGRISLETVIAKADEFLKTPEEKEAEKVAELEAEAAKANA